MATTQDSIYWQKNVGQKLDLLLSLVKYPYELRHCHTQLFNEHIAPKLGCCNLQQKHLRHSFMTDNGAPIELCWDWGKTGDLPSVKYAFEAMYEAPTGEKNAFDTSTGRDCVRALAVRVPGTDLELFEHFSKTLTVSSAFTDEARIAAEQHRSQLFLGIDMQQNCVVKAYFVPTFRASIEGLSSMQLIARSVRSLGSFEGKKFRGFELLTELMQEFQGSAGLTAEIFSIDCVAPSRSRYKIYIRSRLTSFASVKRMLTVNGRLGKDAIPASAMDQLSRLWKLLMPANADEAQELAKVEHRTAGMIYYFEVKEGEDLTPPKLYIPVRHYCRGDRFVVAALREYLRCEDPEKDFAYGDAYEKVVQDICHIHRKSRGVHTYVTCKIVDGSLAVASYLNPVP